MRTVVLSFIVELGTYCGLARLARTSHGFDALEGATCSVIVSFFSPLSPLFLSSDDLQYFLSLVLGQLLLLRGRCMGTPFL